MTFDRKSIIKLFFLTSFLAAFNPGSIGRLIARGVLPYNEGLIFLSYLVFLVSLGFLLLFMLRGRIGIIARCFRLYYKNLVVLFLATVISLITAETALRIRERISGMRPHYVRSYETGYLVRKNSQGFRDEEFKPAKASDVFRILLIGDSFVEGAVPEEYTFDKLLEKSCKDSGLNCEAYNLGIAGTGPSDYLLVARRFKDYRPDLIILSLYVDNDIEWQNFLKTEPSDTFLQRLDKKINKMIWHMGREARLLKLANEILDKKKVHKLVANLPIENFYKELIYRGQIDPYAAWRGMIGDNQKYYDYLVSRFNADPGYRDSILEIRRLYRDKPFLVLINPSKYQVNIEYFDAARKIGYIFKENKLIDRKLQDAVISWLNENGVEWLDLLPGMLDASLNATFFYKFDDHYTAPGNKFVIDRLYQRLEEQGILRKGRQV